MAVSSFSTKDLVSGGIFVVAGAYFAIESLSYEVGTAFRMGPGFMPLALGAVLAALGIGVAASGWQKPDKEKPLPPSWRGIALIIGVVIFFGATIRGLGFVPVVFVSAFASAMASRPEQSQAGEKQQEYRRPADATRRFIAAPARDEQEHQCADREDQLGQGQPEETRTHQ